MPAFNAYWISLTTCGAISFILYLFLMATILRYRSSSEMLQSSFFTIWISLGIADCLQYLHSFFLVRLPLLGVFYDFYKSNDNGFLPKFALMGTSYLLFVQLFGNLLFALNRYTGMTRPIGYEQIWTKGHRLAFTLAAQWVLAILFVAQQFRATFIYGELPDGSLLINTVNPDDFMVDGFVASSTACIVMIICAVLYIFAILSFIRHKNTNSAALREKNSIEIRLSIAVIIAFVSMAAYALFDLALAVLTYLRNTEMINAIIPFFFIINDVFAMINPWSLVLTSLSIRLLMRKMLGLVPTTNVTPTVS